MKLTRLRKVGHCMRQDNGEITRKVLNTQFGGKIKRGRLVDDVQKYVKDFGLGN